MRQSINHNVSDSCTGLIFVISTTYIRIVCLAIFVLPKG